MSEPKLPGIGVTLPDAMTDRVSDGLYAIGARQAKSPTDLSCQFCGARPGERCVNPDGRSYTDRSDKLGSYADHESRWRAYPRLPNVDRSRANRIR